MFGAGRDNKNNVSRLRDNDAKPECPKSAIAKSPSCGTTFCHPLMALLFRKIAYVILVYFVDDTSGSNETVLHCVQVQKFGRYLLLGIYPLLLRR